jgi:integrase
MRRNITAKLVDHLQPPAERRYEVRDTLVPGFGLRVYSTGKKTWFAVGRLGSRQIRHTIGTYPVVSLAEAREAARLILRDIQLDQYAPAKETTAEVTLGQTIDSFIEIYAKPKNRGWKAARATLRKFTSLSARPIREIKRSDVVQILDTLVSAGTPVAANRTLSAIKKVFAWALDRGVIDSHPLIGLRPPSREVSRDRVLTDHQLARLWSLTVDIEFPFGPLLRILILTGQRRGEVAQMRWSQIDVHRRVWTIPSEVAKNRRVHDVPLSDIAVALLSALPRFVGSDLVFTTTGETPVSGFGRLKRRLDTELGFSDWRIHDLRRTVASGMARLAVAPHVIEKVLNHLSGQVSGVAAVYNRHGYQAEKAQALAIWSREIASLTSSTDDGRIVPAGEESLARSIQNLGFGPVSANSAHQ